MATSSDISLQGILTVIKSLEGVVAKFYGPGCSQTLLTNPTGKVVVTSDGYTVLHALHFSHPVACLVKNAMEKCHAQTHDGTKTFLIYLASMLRSLDSRMVRLQNKGSSHQLERQAMIALSLGLNKFSGELTMMYQQLVQHSLKLHKHLQLSNSCLEILKCVSVVTLQPQFSSRLSNYLSGVLISMIEATQPLKIIETLRFIVDNFDVIILKVPNQPYGNCRTFERYLLQREFAVKCDNIQGQVKAVLLCCPVDNSRNESEHLETFLVKSEAQFADSLYHRNKIITAFAVKCKQMNVSLVLSTEGVAGYALDIFREHGISVVSYVSTEDINLIERLTNKTALFDIFSELQDNNILSVNHCADLIVGTQKCIHLQFDSGVKFRHLVACAPTVGMCDQLCWQSHKAMVSMLHCFQQDYMLPLAMCTGNGGTYSTESCVDNYDRDNNDPLLVTSPTMEMQSEATPNNLNITKNDRKSGIETSTNNRSPTTVMELSETTMLLIESGGVFEIIVSHHLGRFIRDCPDVGTVEICQILTDTLMVVPHSLYVNTTVGKPQARQYLKVRHTLEDKARHSDGGWGVGMYGEPCDMRESRCVEPLLTKIHTLDCVLRLVVQLLRIDGILSGNKSSQ